MENRYDNQKVSVITPIYNAERFLRETLDSILTQTYKDIEIVLVDDCSKDASATIIREYSEKHDNILYHLQEKNMGAAVARNTALQLATGRYVAFLDSDDLWEPEKVQRQIDLMRQENAAICFTAIDMVDETGKQIKSKRPVKRQVDYRFLLHNTMLATSSIVVDRKLLGDFRMPLRRSGQDYATWLQLMRNGAIAYGIDEALVHYRVSSGSLSSNKFKSIKQVWEIQTKDENISKPAALFHVFCFCLNAFKKYFM